MESPTPSVKNSDMAIASSCCAVFGYIAIQCLKLLPEGHYLKVIFSDESLLVPLSAICTSVMTFGLSRLSYYVSRRHYRLEYQDKLNTFDELIAAAKTEESRAKLEAKRDELLNQKADELLNKQSVQVSR
ncbi:hypothetical protein [Photobacterium damselae]|uniref:hypothetical protein n=1 Tax=Photobacterium damselae TaxID=38293 RepID=UPI000D04E09F|nr:hypothetical protein [Photobacterium damselae]AWK81864.1 hypothetical protein BST98_07255 [Photobacterium damselae]EJN6958705.1 hypothetical protein [Photobacterium damselae]PSB77723.1 hypothetical protein C5F61_10240 [Photobacterium damselae subsp. damselae]